MHVTVIAFINITITTMNYLQLFTQRWLCYAVAGPGWDEHYFSIREHYEPGISVNLLGLGTEASPELFGIFMGEPQSNSGCDCILVRGLWSAGA